ncbi:acyl-CoA carboxylase epsilon subunit [Nocardia fluminea]|uniref:Acyl-CoA carboxylase epsilon subunit-like protein n=1 Tax=Nocardia fluminea TaxID=134984 RepID=A0A2N3V5F0_9NOCA|nr:acyl-CoA carboxylase epsilon subunit [Nocardia fluminea]PKV76853.1 acyl-CoA carboxylase epsilon subunit-like protein [Nocardia fluminea]
MSATDPAPFLRVEKGSADPDELGALLLLLLARRRAAAVPPSHTRPVARWRRLERRPAFTDPRAWTRSTR